LPSLVLPPIPTEGMTEADVNGLAQKVWDVMSAELKRQEEIRQWKMELEENSRRV